MAKRICKAIVSESKKINDALRVYNAIPPFGNGTLPHKLNRSDVVALDADVWQHISPTYVGEGHIPPLMMRKLIDTAQLVKRAEEEIEITSRDIERLVRSLTRQEEKLSTEIERLKEASTPLECGTLCLLVRRKFSILISKKRFATILSNLKSSNETTKFKLQDFVELVENMLSGRDFVPKTPTSSDEPATDLITDIQRLQEENEKGESENVD